MTDVFMADAPEHLEWAVGRLQAILDLPDGIPCHDTKDPTLVRFNIDVYARNNALAEVRRLILGDPE